MISVNLTEKEYEILRLALDYLYDIENDEGDEEKLATINALDAKLINSYIKNKD